MTSPNYCLHARRAAPRVLAGFASGAAIALGSLEAYGATYYVAPTGSDTNAGTLQQPFASISRAQQAAAAGDTVFFRGGTYRFVSSSAADGILLNRSGSSGNTIKYWAYAGEVPIFDFSGMTAELRITGLRVTGSWIHLKGLEVKLVPQNLDKVHNESWGIYNLGSNNIYELLNLHHNMGPGFFLGGGSNNLILNCDSHRNYDPRSRAGDGENADGFGCHPKAGDTGNVFRGVRAWWNTDDGYDSINALEPCLVENSWAWYNGYLPDTMREPNRDPTLPPGNGNGFKLGGFGIDGAGSPAAPPRHTIRTSLAFLNVFAGFFANYHTGAHFFYNNTGFGNVGADFDMLGLNNRNTSVLRNNVALGPSPTKNLNGTDNTQNAWNLPVQVSEADFQSISIEGVEGPRQADGSLPVLALMRLKADSDLIDKGVDIGLPFKGSAPDLGAFESGPIAAAGAAGSAGSGGAGGAGGSAGVAGGAGAAGSAGSGTGGSGVGGSAGVAGGGDGAGGAAGAVNGGSGGAAAGSSNGGTSALAGSGGTSIAGQTAAGGAPASGGMQGLVGGVAGLASGGISGSANEPVDAGCSCRATRQPSSSLAFTGFAAALLALGMRRRRPRAATKPTY
ncbi:MAG TPA: MYXO-CTERM sorting domain-containing protein [Polyangiaceae bacterium]|nr:MYXO-CTERM sorting domain-containing protein [Polyangiaceae bacterium]